MCQLYLVSASVLTSAELSSPDKEVPTQSSITFITLLYPRNDGHILSQKVKLPLLHPRQHLVLWVSTPTAMQSATNFKHPPPASYKLQSECNAHRSQHEGFAVTCHGRMASIQTTMLYCSSELFARGLEVGSRCMHFCPGNDATVLPSRGSDISRPYPSHPLPVLTGGLYTEIPISLSHYANRSHTNDSHAKSSHA